MYFGLDHSKCKGPGCGSQVGVLFTIKVRKEEVEAEDTKAVEA